MSAGQIAVLVASIVCCVAVVGLLVALARCAARPGALARWPRSCAARPCPWWPTPTGWSDQAATEMERVGAVLDTTESVHATVDSASRLAYRAFANPVVKVLAVRAGAATGIRRLAAGSSEAPRNGSAPAGPSRPRNGSR